MSTAAQNTANQANAQHSTGPVTEERKAAVSTNATTHGATSKEAFIKGENPTEYEIHLGKFSTKFRPTDCHEIFLVQSMADAAWRLRRLKVWEWQMLDVCEHADPFLNDELFKRLNRTHRHMQSIERSYHRAFQALNATRKPAAPEGVKEPVPEQSQIPVKPTKSTISEPNATIHPPAAGFPAPQSASSSTPSISPFPQPCDKL